MEKVLSILLLMFVMIPAMAEVTTTTTYTRQAVPFTEAYNRAKAGNTGYSRQEIQDKQALEAKKTQVRNKMNAREQQYKTEQAAQAKRRAELQRQNEAKKKQLQNDVNSQKTGVQNFQRQTVQNKEALKQGIAKDFTELKKETAVDNEE